MWKLLKQQVKLYGFAGYLKIWEENNIILLQSTMTTNHQLQWQIIQSITTKKHIAIKYHFIRKAEATKEVKYNYCMIEDQIADIPKGVAETKI